MGMCRGQAQVQAHILRSCNRDIKRRRGISSRWEESGAQPMQRPLAQPASTCTGAACIFKHVLGGFCSSKQMDGLQGHAAFRVRPAASNRYNCV
eukprot:1138583-Pelagomonas_calceolata.AAC.5